MFKVSVNFGFNLRLGLFKTSGYGKGLGINVRVWIRY